MSTSLKAYDGNEIEIIRKMLETEYNEGHSLDFEVKVDNKPVIFRTNNLERFNSMHDYILEDSKKLSITIFHPVKGKTFYKYSLSTDEIKKDEPVNGLQDMDKVINERLALYEERSDARRLKEKLEQTERELKEAEAYIDELSEVIKTMQIKPNHVGNLDLTQLLSGTLEQLVISNPRVMENLPVLNGLAKGITESHKEKQLITNPGFEGEVSFRSKQATPSAPPDERTQDAYRLYDFLQGSFTPLQRLLISTIIEELAKRPDEINTIADLLNIELQDEDET